MVAYADDFLCSRFNFEFKIMVGYIVRIRFKFDYFWVYKIIIDCKF